jgi:DNA-binding MarR family transcriptional regulator
MRASDRPAGRTGSPSSGGDADVYRRAWSAMRALVLDNERRREVSEVLGIPFGRIKALLRIAEGPVTMGELATQVGIDAPYATLVVDELSSQGLVERRPHPGDRRVKVVTVTARGAGLAARADQILGRPPPVLFELDPSEAGVLAGILEIAHSPGHEPPRPPTARRGAPAARLGSTRR